jgi:hypothetical protein
MRAVNTTIDSIVNVKSKISYKDPLATFKNTALRRLVFNFLK